MIEYRPAQPARRRGRRGAPRAVAGGRTIGAPSPTRSSMGTCRGNGSGCGARGSASPPGNQFVLLAVDGENLGGFVCAYGGHDPRVGLLHRQHPRCPCVEAQRDRVLPHEAGRSVARPSLPRPRDLSLGVGGELLRETLLRASRRPRRRRIHHGDPRRSHRSQLSLHLAGCEAAVSRVTSACAFREARWCCSQRSRGSAARHDARGGGASRLQSVLSGLSGLRRSAMRGRSPRK